MVYAPLRCGSTQIYGEPHCMIHSSCSSVQKQPPFPCGYRGTAAGRKDTTPSGTIFKAELLNNTEGAQLKTVRFRKVLDEMALTLPSVHYAKLSLSNAARLSFSDLCILLFMFLSLCRLCVCVFLCSHWSLVDVPLIFFCPADHVPDWQPRVLLGMFEARSVNVKKTTTTTLTLCVVVFSGVENLVQRGVISLT